MLQLPAPAFRGLPRSSDGTESACNAGEEGSVPGSGRSSAEKNKNPLQKVKVAQSCPTLCHPIDYTVHGTLQARILEWVDFPFSGGIFPTQRSNPGLPHCRQILYQLSHKGSPRILEWVAYPFSRGSSRPRNRIAVSYIAGRFSTY